MDGCFDVSINIYLLWLCWFRFNISINISNIGWLSINNILSVLAVSVGAIYGDVRGSGRGGPNPKKEHFNSLQTLL